MSTISGHAPGGSAALIVFDLDGTLVDSRLDLAESTNEMLAAYGAPPLPVERIVQMVGDGARVLVERALAASGLDRAESQALRRFLEIYDRRLLVHTRLYDDMAEVVAAAAARAALAVLTNKPEAPSRRLLAAFHLESRFMRVIGGDSGWPRKPDPAGLTFLVAEARTTAGATMMIGDSVVDVETARRAGTAVCFARYGFGHHQRGTPTLDAGDAIAATSAEVGAAIDRFLDRVAT